MIKKILEFYTRYFAVWVILSGVAAYLWPKPLLTTGEFNLAKCRLGGNVSDDPSGQGSGNAGGNLCFHLYYYSIRDVGNMAKKGTRIKN